MTPEDKPTNRADLSKEDLHCCSADQPSARSERLIMLKDKAKKKFT
ncbi:hypothetical protein SynMVIR181_01202 [Synechococcus sp. MVIR-18-1]|nr:hypothetical protein SynMVIR181_01202 [Synechococcus sp. MVIR-18-1]